jgi:hypothetical protein
MSSCRNLRHSGTAIFFRARIRHGAVAESFKSIVDRQAAERRVRYADLTRTRQSAVIAWALARRQSLISLFNARDLESWLYSTVRTSSDCHSSWKDGDLTQIIRAVIHRLRDRILRDRCSRNNIAKCATIVLRRSFVTDI